MTGLEAAIRNALSRAEARDPQARARIYEATRQALEKGLAQRPDLDPAIAEGQRERFEALVSQIESEEREDDLPEMPRRESEAARPGDAAPAVEPDREESPPEAVPPVMARRLDAKEPSAGKAYASPVQAETRPDRSRRGRRAEARERRMERRERRKSRRGGLLSSLFVLVTLLIFGGLILWFVDVTGLLSSTTTTGGGANSFSKFDGGPELATGGGFVGSWTPVYRPGKDADPAAGRGAKVELVDSERGKAVRITSQSADDSGAVRFTVPASALQVLADGKATIAINARAVDGKPTQISVECDFGDKGVCRRRRVDVANEMTDVVFNAEIQQGAGNGGASGNGTILVDSDVSGKGRPVDIFAIGVRSAGSD